VAWVFSHARPDERVANVHCTEDTLAVDRMDGRTIIVPLAWYPRLLHATPEQRDRWEIAMRGAPSPEFTSKESLQP